MQRCDTYLTGLDCGPELKVWGPQMGACHRSEQLIPSKPIIQCPTTCTFCTRFTWHLPLQSNGGGAAANRLGHPDEKPGTAEQCSFLAHRYLVYRHAQLLNKLGQSQQQRNPSACSFLPLAQCAAVHCLLHTMTFIRNPCRSSHLVICRVPWISRLPKHLR